MVEGWQGERIKLVPLDKERHMANAYAWVNDPEVTDWVLIGDMPVTRIAEEKFFERTSTSDNEVIFAVELLDGTHIGMSGLHRIDHFNKTAITGSIFGRKELWGKGYGTEAAIVRARYAFEVLGLRILQSAFLEGNERSARMQEKVGYQVAGRIPQWFWKRGAYRDEVITILTKERFLELHG